jgi:hypothetical protein
MISRYKRSKRGTILITFFSLYILGCEEANRYEIQDILLSEDSVEDGIWESSAWDGELFPIEPQTTVRLKHRLGKVPRSIDVYTSFKKKGGLLSPASGEQISIVEVNKDSIILRNEGGGLLYYRIVVK